MSKEKTVVAESKDEVEEEETKDYLSCSCRSCFGARRFACLGRRDWIEEITHECAEGFEVDGLGDVVAEAGFDTFVEDVGHDVCGEGDDGHPRMFFLLLPSANFATGLVAVFVWHVKIALCIS